MKNKSHWKESKFVEKGGALRASGNAEHVNIASRLTTEVTAEFYQEIIPLYFRGKLLDLGCGEVPLYGAYKKYVDENVCIDWENTEHDVSHLDQSADLNEAIPFPSDSFDTILLSDVLEHIRKPQDLLNECHRLLRSGGHLILNVPFNYGLHEEPFDYYRYTRHGLSYLLKESGFEIYEIRNLGGVPEILTDIFSKSIILLPGIGKLLARCLQWISYYARKIKPIRMASEFSGKKLPLSYGVVAGKK